MEDLLDKKNLLEKNLNTAQHTSNENDRQRLMELENQIRILNTEIETTKNLINEKDMLVEEKNKMIEHLTSQNKNSSFSYELFQKKNDDLEGRFWK
jgi:TolA-binding protein